MKQLSIPKILKVGEYYTNDQIGYALEVGNSGGIRPKLKNKELDFVVLITSAEETKKIIHNPYADKIEGDILTYTGAGLQGDQALSGVNKRLIEQREKPIPILGFLKEKTNEYKFIGFLFLLRHYQDYQLDNQGNLRKVWLFEFQIYSDIPVLNIGGLDVDFLPFYDQFKKEVLPGDITIDSILSASRSNEVSVVEDDEAIKHVEELKKNLLTIDPYQFETVMAKLIEHTGFINVEVTKKSGDDGIDVNALLKHQLSLDLHYQFQVKRWKHSVGRKEVANLRGSLGFNSFGVIIATSHFTASAINEAQGIGKAPIHLIGMRSLYEIIKETEFVI